MRFQAQALRFQRDRAAAGEGVEQGRRVAIGRQADQLAGGFEHLLIGGAFPQHQPLDEVEEALAGRVVLGGVLAARQDAARLHVGGWRGGVVGVVHEGSEDHGTAGGQRPARPP